MRPLHESVVKEKSEEISLIGAGNEANNQLLASFPTKSSGVSTILLVIRLVQRSQPTIVTESKPENKSFRPNAIS